MQIHYSFRLPDQSSIDFSVDLDRGEPAVATPSRWTSLDFHQCGNCPLQSAESPQCPAARDVAPVVDRFTDLISHSKVDVTVRSEARTIQAHCDVQTALSSLLGLIMATSDCPVLSRLRGLARTHLPFQSLEETQFRLVGAWLLGQLIAAEDGRDAALSLQGLNALMDEIGTVNQAFMARIRAAAREDASMNALAMLATSALGVQFSLDEPGEDLAQFAIG